MPAAAVIPAPVAYTNIAAVETFVVCLWVTGLTGGPERWGNPSSGHKHLAVCPAPALGWPEQLLREAPFSGG